MRALIVDDERLARKELMKLLEDHPMIEVVGEAMNAEEATQMVNLCLDAGVNLFATANVYSTGMAEEILGKALTGLPLF